MPLIRFEDIEDGRRFKDSGEEAKRMIEQLTERLGRKPQAGDEYNGIRINQVVS